VFPGWEETRKEDNIEMKIKKISKGEKRQKKKKKKTDEEKKINKHMSKYTEL
jgi:hypothetical protein